MQSCKMKMTTAQFAKMHGVNKRTLHYYDSAGLFSPSCKGENKYRYYDYLQGIDFEYIRMLKELNMSIEEIKDYMRHPGEEEFLQIADTKLEEIDRDIERLKRTKQILRRKRRQLQLCREIKDKDIRITECGEERCLVTPFAFENDDMEQLYTHIKDAWSPEQYSMGIGSYISVDNIRAKKFDRYEGLFTYAPKKTKKGTMTRPGGTYVCGFLRGSWDDIPAFYEEIENFAEEENLELTGYAYEIGVNDFAVQNMNDYVTQILIKAERKPEK